MMSMVMTNLCCFSHAVSWVGSGNELCQFLRILLFILIIIWQKLDCVQELVLNISTFFAFPNRGATGELI